MLAPSRRSRRTRAPLFALGALLLIITGLIALGGSRTSPTEARTAALGYLDRVRPLIERSTSAGKDLALLLDKARAQAAAQTQLELDRLVQDAGDTLVLARSVNPPKADVIPHELLLGSLAARAVAVDSVRAAMRVALDPKLQSVAATEALTTSGRDLIDADAAYGLFARHLPMANGSAGADFTPPSSAWVQNPTDWSAPVLGAYVTALRSSKELAPVHDVAVLVAETDPAPVAKDATFGILPLLRVYKVNIIVANQGNQPEREVPVTVTVTRLDTTESTVTHELVDMEAGGRKAISLAFKPPDGNVAFSLSVRIGPLAGVATPVNPVDDELIAQYQVR